MTHELVMYCVDVSMETSLRILPFKLLISKFCKLSYGWF